VSASAAKKTTRLPDSMGYGVWGGSRPSSASSSTPAGCLLQLKHMAWMRARETRNPPKKIQYQQSEYEQRKRDSRLPALGLALPPEFC
jgi:hypothetical protein